MPDTFTLLTFSFCFILHNVCSSKVSQPLNHTFNEDNSVSVTCMFLGKEKAQLEAKLKMNNEYVCEVYNKSQAQDEKKQCKWQHEGNKFTFTLMNPEGLHKNTFSCEMLKIKPYPVETYKGPGIKLFRGCNQSLPPPKNDCQILMETDYKTCTTVKSYRPEEMYALLFCGVIIMVITVYSMIITVLYIRLRATKASESSDTPTYVPMQRKRNLENTEYVDMREVQKQGGCHRDLNHNSHLA